jgi:hypothetical protein
MSCDVRNCKASENTGRELWRRVPDDFYSPSIHVTEDGSVGIDVGGTVIVAPVEEWHGLRKAIADGGFDLSPCGNCGTPVVCIPDGLPMCETCATVDES